MPQLGTSIITVSAKCQPSTKDLSSQLADLFRKAELDFVMNGYPEESLLAQVLVTTRTPLFVQPALWTQRHLCLLHVIVEDRSIPLPLLVDEDKRLHQGCIDALRLMQAKEHFMKHKPFQFIENLIWDTVYSFRTLKSNERFIIHHQNSGGYTWNGFNFQTTLTLHFDDKSIRLKPGFFIRSANRCDGPTRTLPVLAYNDNSRRQEARNRALGSLPSKKLKMAGCHNDTTKHIGIEPYDVAVLIAMAQEQHGRLSKTVEPPDVYVAHMTVIDEERNIFLYTAQVGVSYLRSIFDPKLPLTEDLRITRTPIPLDDGGAMLLNTITNILEGSMKLVASLKHIHPLPAAPKASPGNVAQTKVSTWDERVPLRENGFSHGKKSWNWDTKYPASGMFNFRQPVRMALPSWATTTAENTRPTLYDPNSSGWATSSYPVQILKAAKDSSNVQATRSDKVAFLSLPGQATRGQPPEVTGRPVQILKPARQCGNGHSSSLGHSEAPHFTSVDSNTSSPSAAPEQSFDASIAEATGHRTLSALDPEARPFAYSPWSLQPTAASGSHHSEEYQELAALRRSPESNTSKMDATKENHMEANQSFEAFEPGSGVLPADNWLPLIAEFEGTNDEDAAVEEAEFEEEGLAFFEPGTDYFPTDPWHRAGCVPAEGGDPIEEDDDG